MNKMKTCFFTLIALLSLTIANAQTADEIIAKHADAIGGKDKISQINSVYLESTTSVMGNDGPTKTYIVNGKAYKNESEFAGQNFVTVVTDTGGWKINAYEGASDPTALSDDEFKRYSDEIYTTDPLANYAANGGKVELVGQEQVNNVNAYKLKYTNKYGLETFYYIDPATWYIIQTTSTATAMGQEVLVTTTFSNYTKTDFGIFMPYTIRLDLGQFALDVNTQKIEINKDIDPKIFEMSK
ncbi:MAG TPA: hypothetical protein VFW07_20770 [Parafilimonas sp.]|nr:hypothetical protein [Parafilimonas sp.]